MPLHNFPLLRDNTRLVKFKDTLYKVKVHYDNTFEGKLTDFSESEAHDDIEQVFRAVLYRNERHQDLRPIITQHFVIACKKSLWPFPKKYPNFVFKQNGKVLKAFEYVFEFVVSHRSHFKQKDSKCVEASVNKRENAAGPSRAETSKETVKHDSRKVKRQNSDDDARNQKSKKHQKEVLTTVLNVEKTRENEAPRFQRTKDGRLYRLVNVNVDEDGANDNINNHARSDAHDDDKPYKKRTDDERMERRRKIRNKLTKELNNLMAVSDSIWTNKNENETYGNGLSSQRKTRQKAVSKKSKLKQPYRFRSRNRKDNLYKDPESQVESESEVEQVNRIITTTNRDMRNNRRQRMRSVSKSEKNEVQVYTNNNDTKHRARRYRENSKNYVYETSQEGEMENEIKRGDQKYIKRRKSARVISNTNTVKMFPENENRTVKSLKRPAHHSNRSDGYNNSSQEDDSQTSDNLDVENDRSHSKYIARLKTRSAKKPLKRRSDTKQLSVSERAVKKRKLRRSSRVSDQVERFDSQSTETESELEESLQVVKKGRTVQSVSSQESLGRKHKLYATRQSPQVVLASGNISVQSVSSQESLGRKHKLYATRQSPQVVLASGSRPDLISSPRVSTVLPVKRSNTGGPSSNTGSHDQARLQSPRQRDVIISPRVTRRSMVRDAEMSRIEEMRRGRPAQAYRDILQSHGRDRHSIEQAEREETRKLQQLYKPTVPRSSPGQSTSSPGQPMSPPRQSPQKAMRRRSSGLWGKFMDNLVTPTKRLMNKWK